MRILFVEDYPPRVRYGAGLPRARAIIEALVAQGHAVSLYACFGFRGVSRTEVTEELSSAVEVLESTGPQDLLPQLAKAAQRYDLIWVCRRHHMAHIVDLFKKSPALALPPLVYDTEALSFLRELRALKARGQAAPPELIERHAQLELALAEAAQAVVTVSTEEQAFFHRRGYPRAFLIATAVAARAQTPGPDLRQGLLFVGAVNHDSEPNPDALKHFLGEVWPRLRRTRPCTLRIAGWGTDRSLLVRRLAGPGVEILGPVEDLAPWYDQARVFIAPTRFAAGIPLKVIEAAAHGLPAVVTPLLAGQLGWQPEVELLTGQNAASFADSCLCLMEDDALWTRIAKGARQRAATQFSHEALHESVREVLAAVAGAPR
ncbi:MAG: glycosyltransferase family 4 protein [Betaproteobacteria bacterium]|nr:glycosyltransferase family 4 protein [Betaproteobacteria bacterium]